MTVSAVSTASLSPLAAGWNAHTAVVPQNERRSHISTKAMVWAVNGSEPGTRGSVASSSSVGSVEARCDVEATVLTAAGGEWEE